VTAGEVNAGDGDWSGIGLSPRDADLLADYLGGALSDTTEADVARLIREDPVWRRAHAALAEATAAVGTDLADWGERPEPMPDDVATRLTAALAAAGTLAGATRSAPADATVDAGGGATEDEPDVADQRHVGGGRRGHLSVVPGAATDSAAQARRARPRPRWVRWAGPLAAAAAVVTAVGFGVQGLPDRGGSDDAASTAGGAADVYARSGEAAPVPTGAEQDAPQALHDQPRRLIASGTDYRPETVAGLRATAADAQQPAAEPGPAPPVTSSGRRESALAPNALARVAEPLRRLAATGPLEDCLRTIAAEHGRPMSSVPLVDYASFEGSPALVVAFTNDAGEQWIWVAGPDCGEGTAAASTLYRAKVG
jgi:hypothetical protein